MLSSLRDGSSPGWAKTPYAASGALARRARSRLSAEALSEGGRDAPQLAPAKPRRRWFPEKSFAFGPQRPVQRGFGCWLRVGNGRGVAFEPEGCRLRKMGKR
jgi:hypothetical protein